MGFSWVIHFGNWWVDWRCVQASLYGTCFSADIFWQWSRFLLWIFFCIIYVNVFVWQISTECNFFICSWNFDQLFGPCCSSFSMSSVFIKLIVVIIGGVAAAADWTYVLGYISMFDHFSCFQKCYIPSILYLYDYFFLQQILI